MVKCFFSIDCFRIEGVENSTPSAVLYFDGGINNLINSLGKTPPKHVSG